MCFQEVGRVTGCLCELHAERLALYGERFGDAQMARNSTEGALTADGGEQLGFVAEPLGEFARGRKCL